MPRCGCASGQQVLVQGEDPIVVTGDGTPGSPFVVSVSHGGRQGCEGITACVGEHLGVGLGWDPTTNRISARLSGDAGNAASFGSDGGLMVISGSTPIPEICAQKTIESLAARPQCELLVGAMRQAGLATPFDAPYSTDYCLANSFDFIHVKVAASSDGVGFLHYGTSDLILKAHTNIGTFQQYSHQLSSSALSRVTEWAGDLEDAGMNDCVSTGCKKRGGWWGFHAPPYTKVPLADMLKKVGGRAVVIIDALAGIADQESANVAAALRAIRQHCAQTWAMVGVQTVSMADQVLAGGATPIMMVNGHYAYGTTTLPWPVADLDRPGGQIEWVVPQRNHADSVFEEYRSAGINTLAQYVDRQVDRRRFECGADPAAQPALARGVLSMDPVYTFGPERQEYRSTVDPMRVKQPGPGMLSHQTDRGILSYLGSGVDIGSGTAAWGRSGRGWIPENDEAWRVEPGFGQQRDTPGILMGWACPLPNADEYTIEWQMKAITVNTPSRRQAMMGLLVGALDDRDLYQWAQGSPGGYPAAVRQCYRCYVRLDGSIGIGYWEPGTATYYYLNGTQQYGVAAEAEVTTPALVADQYSTYRIQVTPTAIQLRRTLGSNQWTVTAENNAWRGPYFHFEKRDAAAEDQPATQAFAGQARRFIVTSTPAS